MGVKRYACHIGSSRWQGRIQPHWLVLDLMPPLCPIWHPKHVDCRCRCRDSHSGCCYIVALPCSKKRGREMSTDRLPLVMLEDSPSHQELVSLLEFVRRKSLSKYISLLKVCGNVLCNNSFRLTDVVTKEMIFQCQAFVSRGHLGHIH